MLVTQKNRYALRAIFELAKRLNEGPVKIAEIAEAQAIPPRFLEVILNQLKKAGFVTRDPRVKERKKYGQKGARARFQYSKR